MVLIRLKRKTCLVYLNDILVSSNDINNHVQHVDKIIHCLKEAGVTLKIKKSKYFTTTVDYLDHVIKRDKLEIDHEHTASLKEA